MEKKWEKITNKRGGEKKKGKKRMNKKMWGEFITQEREEEDRWDFWIYTSFHRHNNG